MNAQRIKQTSPLWLWGALMLGGGLLGVACGRVPATGPGPVVPTSAQENGTSIEAPARKLRRQRAFMSMPFFPFRNCYAHGADP